MALNTLNLTNKSWIKTGYVSDELKQYALDNFEKLFAMHPEKRGRVLVYNKDPESPDWYEEECNRWCKSYMNTPAKDDTVLKSYIFSGKDDSGIREDLPDEFKPFYEYVKQLDPRYNQAVINWYNDEDHIPIHADCDANMVDNYEICVLTLNDSLDVKSERVMSMSHKSTNHCHIESLKHGKLLVMAGDFQNEFRHGVRKGEKETRRISITFRQMR
uniref:Fe2OG dioxygenase domain-containing protein n=1 Tax=viral metagenome TaxID=1070528 RepID=A0A6C0CK39_9ZZZZ